MYMTQAKQAVLNSWIGDLRTGTSLDEWLVDEIEFTATNLVKEGLAPEKVKDILGYYIQRVHM